LGSTIISNPCQTTIIQLKDPKERKNDGEHPYLAFAELGQPKCKGVLFKVQLT
jgi:hypothetical protein